MPRAFWGTQSLPSPKYPPIRNFTLHLRRLSPIRFMSYFSFSGLLALSRRRLIHPTYFLKPNGAEPHMNTTIDSPNVKFQLLDALVIIVESWKVLLLFPILVGLLTFGICTFQQRAFGSKARLLMVQTADGVMFSRDLVTRAVKSVPGAPDTTEILNGLSIGQPQKKAEFSSVHQRQLDGYDREISGLLKTIDAIEKSLKRSSTGYNAADNSSASTVSPLSSLRAQVEERERGKAATRDQMQFLPIDIVTAPPIAPALTQGPRIATATIFAFLGAELLALVVVFMCIVLRSEATLPGGAEKVTRIRRALGIHPIASADPAGSK